MPKRVSKVDARQNHEQPLLRASLSPNKAACFPLPVSLSATSLLPRREVAAAFWPREGEGRCAPCYTATAWPTPPLEKS